MTPDKLSTPTGSVTRSNASHSRTYLTRRNYSGPQLLQSIHGRSSPSPHSENKAPNSRSGKMDTLQEDDIMAPPLSSDEEESTPRVVRGKPSNAASAKRKADGSENQLASKKRVRSEGKPTRRSERTVQDSALESTIDSSASIPDFLSSSQSSQQKKRRTQYGKTGSYHRPSSQGLSFADPGELPATPRKSKTGTFKAVDGPPASRERTPKKRSKEIDIPSSAEKVVEKSSAFKLPDGPGILESSSISTEQSKVFDVDDSPNLQPRKRTSSTSSLSSVDSIASYELSQKQKDELRDGTSSQQVPLPKGHIRCPLCQRTIDVSSQPQPPNPDTMTLRRQQTFCHNHRVHDAHTEWSTRGYPTIDWPTLESERVPSHLPHLRQVLYRKQPSFYLDSLDHELQSARGNHSKIRHYLANGIVEVVKTGYYGPRGAKVMAHRITADMANHLKRSLKADKTVRAVGVAGFVSAVLLPELLVRVVAEDMRIEDDDEVRRVVGESTEVGMLLWPDDDHVVRDDEDIGGGGGGGGGG